LPLRGPPRRRTVDEIFLLEFYISKTPEGTTPRTATTQAGRKQIFLFIPEANYAEPPLWFSGF
jgi:hypothetical protein